MFGVNKVILVGNVGKDPEVRYLEGNVPVAKFSFATDESYRNKEGKKIEQTEWHQVVLWRGLAEVAEKYVRKGSKLYIEGKIKSHSWEDKDGVKKYTTEIIGESMVMLDRRESDGNSSRQPAIAEPARVNEPVAGAASTSAPADDLPF